MSNKLGIHSSDITIVVKDLFKFDTKYILFMVLSISKVMIG